MNNHGVNSSLSIDLDVLIKCDKLYDHHVVKFWFETVDSSITMNTNCKSCSMFCIYISIYIYILVVFEINIQ